MIDYHTHLAPHGVAKFVTVDDVRAYAQAAARSGLREVAVTEHFYRFSDVQDALGPWWEDDPDPRLRTAIADYFRRERLPQRLDEYVELVLAAAEHTGDGATIRLGLEVDLFWGRMDEVVSRLRGYPWDILLGAVHWIGAWHFDCLEDPTVQEEWRSRDPDDVWLAYTEGVEELAASGACDVLAHVDLVKLAGVLPATAGQECAERLVKAAAGHSLAVEINTNGWSKPISEAYPAPHLLERFRAADVGITLASDAHDPAKVGHRIGEAAAMGHASGYDSVTLFDGRRARHVPLLSGEE